MIGEKSAIRKYQTSLPVELSKRYGGSGPYTQAQVEVTIEDLGLSNKHIKYAYLMFCDQQSLDNNVYTDQAIKKMKSIITTAFGGGIVGGSGDSIFGASGGDGGFGDGGGGGGE